MYLKRIVFFVTFLCLAFAFSLSAYAKPEEEKTDSFFDTFEINQNDLKTNVKNGNVGLYEVSEDGISIFKQQDVDDTGLDNASQVEGTVNGNSDTTQTTGSNGSLQGGNTANTSSTSDGSNLQTGSADVQTETPDINDYKVFKLYKGFSKLSVITFANSKMLSGNGEENTTVGIMAFSVSEEGKIISLGQSIDTIGPSGIYNTSINLKIGDNNVIIAVKNNDLFIYRLFKVTVKEAETKGLLENIQLNFLPGQSDDDSNDVTNPLPITNLPGFDAVEN